MQFRCTDALPTTATTLKRIIYLIYPGRALKFADSDGGKVYGNELIIFVLGFEQKAHQMGCARFHSPDGPCIQPWCPVCTVYFGLGEVKHSCVEGLYSMT